MIETREALEALDNILGVAGIDGVFIGPADLSIALSNGARWEPRGPAVLEAARRVVASASAHGKYAGMFCYDGADAGAMAELASSCAPSGRTRAFCEPPPSRTRAARRQSATNSGKSRNRTRYHELDGSDRRPGKDGRRALLACIGNPERLE